VADGTQRRPAGMSSPIVFHGNIDDRFITSIRIAHMTHRARPHAKLMRCRHDAMESFNCHGNFMTILSVLLVEPEVGLDTLTKYRLHQ